MTTALLLFGSMALFILIGVPIAFALGAAVWSTIVFSPDFTVTVGIIAQRIFGGLESTSIMAIPFFILAGNLMTKGGISRRLVNFANCIVGNVRGGMALALVLACAFFAALSGSAPATVIAIGSMLYPEMVRMGYPKDRTAGLLVVSGGLGPIIPPSIPLPRQIKSVVIQVLLIGTNPGSATAETAQIIRKYAAPASIPHINLRLAAPLEKKSPASKEEIQ